MSELDEFLEWSVPIYNFIDGEMETQQGEVKVMAIFTLHFFLPAFTVGKHLYFSGLTKTDANSSQNILAAGEQLLEQEKLF